MFYMKLGSRAKINMAGISLAIKLAKTKNSKSGIQDQGCHVLLVVFDMLTLIRIKRDYLYALYTTLSQTCQF